MRESWNQSLSAATVIMSVLPRRLATQTDNAGTPASLITLVQKMPFVQLLITGHDVNALQGSKEMPGATVREVSIN